MVDRGARMGALSNSRHTWPAALLISGRAGASRGRGQIRNDLSPFGRRRSNVMMDVKSQTGMRFFFVVQLASEGVTTDLSSVVWIP